MKYSSCGRALDAGDNSCSECGTWGTQTGQKNESAEYKKTAQNSEAQALTIKGLVFYDKGNYDAGIRVLNKAIELNCDDPDSYYWRGCCYYEKKDYTRAIRDFDKIIEMYPGIATSYYWRGLCYYEKEDYDRAISDLKEVISLDPDDAEAKVLLSKCKV